MSRFKLAVLMGIGVATLMAGCQVPAFANYSEDAILEEEKSEGDVGGLSESVPFSIEGNGQIVDDISNDDSKQFITVKTKNNQTFFVVIDRASSVNNVYMLSTIDEDDLQKFLSEETDGDGKLTIPGNRDSSDNSDNTELLADDEVREPDEARDSKKSGSLAGNIISIVVVMLLMGAGGYFLYKKKKRSKGDSGDDYYDEDEFDEEYEDDEYGDGYDEEEFYDGEEQFYRDGGEEYDDGYEEVGEPGDNA